MDFAKNCYSKYSILNRVWVFVLVCLFTINAIGQSIRKDHREMTPDERDAFVNALLNEETLITNLGIFHGGNFDDIHFNIRDGQPEDDVFLPWHRYMIYELEQELQKHCECISIPYWYWPTDNSTSSSLWEDEFLGQFEDEFDVSRNLGSGTLPSTSTIANVQDITTFLGTNGYTNQVERGPVHSGGHVWVDGTMVTEFSPRDPVFYLHHGMVDKLWQDWEEVNQSSSFPKTNMPRYDGNFTRADNVTLPSINPNSITDARSLGIFFAENEEVVLDKYTVSNSTQSVETFFYQYDIEVEDDFEVPNGKSADVISESSIVFKPGFTAEEGSEFLATINDGHCDFSVYGKRNYFTENEDFLKETAENVYENIMQNAIVEKIDNSTLYSVYNDYIQILPQHDKTIKEIAVYSIDGKLVAQNSSALNNIDIQHLSQGIYSIHVLYIDNTVFSSLFVNK